MRILLVEDQQKVAAFIGRGLKEEHYAVDVAETGEDGVALVEVTPYDLVVLDLMLPDISGTDVCREIRRQGHIVPILMLTARTGLEDKVEGLDAGADDYLTKPFAFPELLARIRSLLRRTEAVKTSTLKLADLSLDTATHKVSRAGTAINLASKEYAVLEYMMRRAGLVLTRTMILEAVWGYDFDPSSNVVDVYIRYLRRKLDDLHEDKLLQTIRGTGYRIRDPSVP